MQPGELNAALAGLAAQAVLRRRVILSSPQGPEVEIDGRRYLNFSSNDYLGLANHPDLVCAASQGLQRWGVGSGSSALVSGHFAIHEQAEQALASFVSCPAALLFGSGYAANLAVLGSFLGRNDAVFADRLIHASLNDGCQLSRARLCRFRHNDLDHLESLLQTTKAHARMIVVDAVYSMDGDEAPLPALLALAHRYDAWRSVTTPSSPACLHSHYCHQDVGHASLNDGCQLSRARLCRFRHNDLDHLESLLQTTKAHDFRGHFPHQLWYVVGTAFLSIVVGQTGTLRH